MGNEQVKKAVKPTEIQVLRQSSEICESLQLHNSQGQLREYRHLIARILIYGHGHLLEHLKRFNMEKQKQMMKEFKRTDYQTTDMLYENLVVEQVRVQRQGKKWEYSIYEGFRNKNIEQRDNLHKYERCIDDGEEALKAKKVAVLLFAGGCSSKFRDKYQSHQKQLYTSNENQKCLFQIAIEKINEKLKIYEDVTVYIVHNEENRKRINQILSKYPNVRAKKMLQNETPIVNLSGKVCLKSKESAQILVFPIGCGDLANLTFLNSKLLQEMIKSNIEYVCALGIENICAQIIDPYFIGVLAADLLATSAFKITYPDNDQQNLRRVVFNIKQKSIEVSDFEVLCQKTDKKCLSIVQKSPVWINSVVFRPSYLQQFLQKKRQKFDISKVFTSRQFHTTYWNPQSGSYSQNQHCFMFERELSDLILNKDMRSIGIMVEREKQFVPVITLNGEKNWIDAYNQYEYQEKNKGKSRKVIERDSLGIFGEKSEF